MIEKTKKVYEAPSMKVYEIGRSQILAGSNPAANNEDFGTDPNSMQW